MAGYHSMQLFVSVTLLLSAKVQYLLSAALLRILLEVAFS